MSISRLLETYFCMFANQITEPSYHHYTVIVCLIPSSLHDVDVVLSKAMILDDMFMLDTFCTWFTLNQLWGVVTLPWAGFIYYSSSPLTAVLSDGSPARDDAVLSRIEDVRRGWDADRLDVRSESKRLLQLQHSHITVRVHGVIMWRDDQWLDFHCDCSFLHTTQ